MQSEGDLVGEIKKDIVELSLNLVHNYNVSVWFSFRIHQRRELPKGRISGIVPEKPKPRRMP